MIAFTFDVSLNSKELDAVEECVGEAVEWIPIPQLFRSRGARAYTVDAVRPLLARMPSAADSAGRVLLVQCSEPERTAQLLEGLRERFGVYPVLVQTEGQREALGIPGPLRLVDVEAYVLADDSNSPPPWA